MRRKAQKNVLVIFITPITKERINVLSDVYAEVFSGYPYYEDRVCEGIKDERNPCKLQYTPCKLPEDFESVNLEKRAGVISSTDLEVCRVCGRRLMRFYPDFVDQRKLVLDAIQQKEFIGYLLEKNNRMIGFTWGYQVPKEKTPSVNFTSVRNLLEKQGIDSDRSFYCAELGVIEQERQKGLGLLLSTKRIYTAARNGFATLLVRTKNPVIKAINKRLFDTEAKELFQDPERDYCWFGWFFKNFKEKEALSIIGGQNEYKGD